MYVDLYYVMGWGDGPNGELRLLPMASESRNKPKLQAGHQRVFQDAEVGS